MAEIVTKEMTKRYPNGFEAVKALSLDIAEGELLDDRQADRVAERGEGLGSPRQSRELLSVH